MGESFRRVRNENPKRRKIGIYFKSVGISLIPVQPRNCYDGRIVAGRQPLPIRTAEAMESAARKEPSMTRFVVDQPA